ncbi:microtubule integrity protein mal3 [Dipsacomyces acuminosporus]|nr:microtubule integrity protein mal3 [Dipsacomyces acuminosporus]
MSESRQTLISWVNDLLQTNYTKVEQLGSGNLNATIASASATFIVGAAYCQIIDSIYLDVPVGRIKFDANQTYEYMENFKILQNSFSKHKIDKPVDPTRLMKCRFQDNFEFLQWLKRFWDSYYSGQHYDAVGRRKGRAVEVSGPRPRSSASSARSSSASAFHAKPVASRVSAARPPPGGARTAAIRSASRTGAGAAGAGANTQQLQELTRQVNDAKVLIETAEKERDFYFTKLREIEVYLQQAQVEPGSEVEAMASHIQSILYSTDDGFVGEEVEGAQDELQNETFDQVSGKMHDLHVDEEETF